MLDLERLLAPLDGDVPVGPDLRSEPEFRDIEDMPGDFANQKPPELKQTIAKCEAFLDRTKDQMPAIVIVQAAVRIGDFQTANSALEVIHGFADTYWDNFHPGPAEDMAIGRINELSALARPAAMTLPLQRTNLAALPAPSTVGFTAAMIAQACLPTAEWTSEDEEALGRQIETGQITAAAARGLKPVRDGARTLRAIMRALSAQARAADAEAGIDMDDAGLDETTRRRIAIELRDQVSGARDALQGMSDMLYSIIELYDSRAGDSPSIGPVLSAIRSIVDDTGRFVELFTETEADEEVATDAVPEGGSGGGGASPQAAAPKSFVAMTPRTRDDVKAALDSIQAYYSANEPSSPVPLILRRVRTWVTKDFMELVAEMAPNAVDDVQKLLATSEE